MVNRIGQKQLNNGFSMPVNVTRIGRKVFFSSDVNEESMHELLRILAEIEQEDDDMGGQDNVESSVGGIFNILGAKKGKLNKDELKEIEEVCNDFRSNIESPSSLDREPIQLYISSYGGCVYSALSYIDYIRTMKTPIHAIAIGKAMSAGALMLLASDRRYATQNATILIHQISSGTFGTLQGMLENLAETQRLSDLINEIIMTYTDVNEELLTQIQESKYDYYMTPEEALKLAIIDEII